MQGGIVVVCGGRDFARAEVVDDALRNLRPTLLIQGGATGADALAKAWAMRRGVPLVEVPALWEAQGQAAGPKRNRVMAEVAKRIAGDKGWTLMAFPGGRGTASMVSIAQRMGAEVVTVPARWL